MTHRCANLHVMKRLTPKQYAEACGVVKPTVYAWIRDGKMPAGTQVTKTPTNRFIIHVDWAKHPPTPLFTEPA